MSIALPTVLTAAVVAGLVPGGGTPAAATAPAQSNPFYGVVLQQKDLVKGDVRRMRSGRVGTVRFVVSWAQIERRAGHYDFSRTDAMLAGLRKAGAEPMPVIFGKPHWLGAPGPPIDTQEERAAWQAFLTKLVRRYGVEGELATSDPDFVPVERWQIWNEPNIPLMWGRDPNPAEYVDLLRISAPAIHAVDPSATIIAGGLPPAPMWIPDTDFIRAVYARYEQLGVAPDFDELAAHPYGRTVNKSLEAIDNFAGAVRRWRPAGSPMPPITVAEVGWGSSGKHPQFLSGTPANQASRLEHIYRGMRERRKSDNLRAVLWFAWRDEANTTCRFCSSVGLLSAAGPKPAWASFKALTKP